MSGALDMESMLLMNQAEQQSMLLHYIFDS